MKASKKGFANGGTPMINSGREAEQEKMMEEGHSKGGRAKKRSAGGATTTEGAMAPKRFDRPGRKQGGAVGATKKPLSSANSASSAEGHSTGADEMAPE